MNPSRVAAFLLLALSASSLRATTIRWNAGFDGFRPGEVYFAASVQASNTGFNRSVTLFRYSPVKDEIAEIAPLPGPTDFPDRQLAFHPSGEGLFIASAGGVKLLQPDGLLVDFAPSAGTISDLSVGGDGVLFASGATGVRRYFRGGSAPVFGVNSAVWGVAVRPEGGWVVGIEPNQARYGNNNLLWVSLGGVVERGAAVSTGRLGLVRARSDGTFVVVSDVDTTLNLVQPGGSYQAFAGRLQGVYATHGIALDAGGNVWVSTGGRPATLQSFTIAGSRLTSVSLELNSLGTLSETGFLNPSGVAVAPILPISNISGLVRTAALEGIAGVTLNGLPGSPVTDAAGSYNATVESGWSGTVTPSKPGFTFSPPSTIYANVTSNQTQNYTGALLGDTYIISGQVRTAALQGIAGVTLNGLPGNPVTDAGGNYSAAVTSRWSGTVTPSKPGYIFNPTSITYEAVTSDQTQNYTGRPLGVVYSISGQVRTAALQGIVGVALNGLPGNPVTDAAGNYSATVDSAWSGTVTPWKPGYTFVPPSTTYTNVSSNLTQNYTGTPLFPPFSPVSAASFLSNGPVAPASIAAGFGGGLVSSVVVAPPTSPLPTSLAGTSVKVTDSAGVERLAPLWFVSPDQINFYIPDGAETGAATVTVEREGRTVASGRVSIESVAAGLFTMNANGQGVAAAQAIRVKADGSQSWQYVFSPGCAVGSCTPVPIDLGPETDEVYLQLYGTGIRRRSLLAAVKATIGGLDVPVGYAGPVSGMVGLDQVNLRVPRSLIGRGQVVIVLTVDGKAANPVTVSIK